MPNSPELKRALMLNLISNFSLQKTCYIKLKYLFYKKGRKYSGNIKKFINR